MIITLVGKEKLISIKIPDKCYGKYWITDDERPLGDNKLLSIEADEEAEQWIIKSTLTVTLYDKNQTKTEKLELHAGDLYFVQFGAIKENSGFIYVEDSAGESVTFTKYIVKTGDEIRIGRSTLDNHIVIDNPMVSSFHGVLTFTDGVWKIFENTDTNGIYVNGKRIEGNQVMKYGDVIYIFGVKIIVGARFIAINNPNSCVLLDKDFFEYCSVDDYVDDIKPSERKENYYFRSPRFIRSITPLELKVDMPPQQEKSDDVPIALTLAPSMVMGVASFAMGIFTLVNSMNNGGNILNSLPTLIMAVSMLIGMIVFPFIMKKRERKMKIEKEKLRKEKYLKYLDNLKAEVSDNKKYQEEILRENNPAILNKIRYENFWTSGLWSKGIKQPDYLFIRLGEGNTPMQADIGFPEDRFTLDDDEMRKELFAFQAEEKLLLNVPVGIDLKTETCVGIAGNNKNIINTLNNIIMQITLMHGYDEVKLVCICEEKDFKQIEYVKALGHVWNNSGTERYIACNEDEIMELSVRLSKIIQKRCEQDLQKAPYFVVLVASRVLSNFAKFINEIDYEKDDKFRVIYCYDDEKELPRECNTVVKLDTSNGLIYGRNTENYNGINFVQDRLGIKECVKAAKKMARFKLDISDNEHNLPKIISFMEMYEVGKAEHLNIMHRWENNSTVTSLKAPVGVDINGDLLYLDLHEKMHGPHGLIAGMTGSGKSEFIITYILSLAVNYHPNEVAFVLIDYKGGGLAAAFDNPSFRLPHLAGTITNLDAGSTFRCILAINSELKRRQRLFNEVKQRLNEGTMDIYKYQKMFRAGLIDEPMPHLFIITDEFAELKTQQSEFMSELISIARIGRSLGVHLILATQKPSGVVDDQIWANSRFKVCLKVQDRSDSTEMLKRPEAAELSDVGRFYLQVGYNELFVLGQSAWCGANYFDTDSYVKNEDRDIEIIDRLGNVYDRIKHDEKNKQTDNGEQIVRILQYVAALAESEKIHERQLWLPELPEKIFLDEIMPENEASGTDKLIAVIGMLDNPYEQKQQVLTIKFEEEGNAIVYGNSVSGVGLLINAAILSMCRLYSPEIFNAYILDFENETLKMFGKFPQVADVLTEGDDEKINNLFSMLRREIKYRKEKLVDDGGNINKYNDKHDEKIAKILIVIYNYSYFIECYNKYEEENIALTRDCTKYGIYFLITAGTSTEIRFRTAQNFSRQFVLKLNDPMGYTAILGSTGGMVPEKYYGRGILKNKEIYSFQTAYITQNEDELGDYLEESAKELLKQFDGYKAKPLPCIPPIITAGQIPDDLSLQLDNFYVGMQFSNYSPVTLDLKNNFIIGIFAENLKKVTGFVTEFVKESMMIEVSRVIIFNSNKDIEKELSYLAINNDDIQEAPIELVGADKENLELKLNEIYNNARLRNAKQKEEGKDTEVDMSPDVCILNDFSSIRSIIDSETNKNIEVMLKKAEAFWNITFIVTDSLEGLKNYSHFSWYANNIRNNCIWLGNKVRDFSNFVIISDDKNLKNELMPNCGYIFKNGRYKMAKLIGNHELEEGDENE